MKVYLRIGDDPLEDAQPHRSKAEAIAAYADVARELARYDQRIEATIHVAKTAEELTEYPDWVLTLSPRGAVVVTRT